MLFRSEAVSAVTLTVAQTDGVKEKEEVFAPTTPEPEVIAEPKKAEPKKAAVGAEPSLESLVGEWDDI